MSRVFYYSGYRMTAFHWAGERLIDEYSFTPDELGFKDFEQYLEHSPNDSVRILVDVIEEDYFKDTLPHVSAKDQQAMLARRVKRDYPESSEWFYSRIVGRELEGRKDDNIIYSVQTNPQLLDPWLDLMKKQQVSISGIWSLSLLSEKLIKLMAIKDENILLVTQQVPSNLRQSFFKKGKLQTSRSAVVNLNDMSLSEHIVKELNQTSSYLANQRHIGFDEIMMVHVISPEKEIKSLKEKLEDTAIRKYHFHNLEDVEKLVGGVSDNEVFCDGLFSSLCASQFFSRGQYGAKELFIYFHKKIFSKTLLLASVLVVVFLSLIVLYSQSEIFQLEKDIEVSRQYAEKINLNYQRQFSPIQEKLNQSRAIQSTVLFYQQAEKNRAISPQQSLLLISSILKKTKLSDIEITAIKWNKVENNNLMRAKGKNNSAINYALSADYSHKINLRGYLGSVNDSVDVMADKVSRIKKILENNPNISDVKLKKLPVDIRINKNIKSISGVDVNSSQKQNWNQFEIEFRMKAG